MRTKRICETCGKEIDAARLALELTHCEACAKKIPGNILNLHQGATPPFHTDRRIGICTTCRTPFSLGEKHDCPTYLGLALAGERLRLTIAAMEAELRYILVMTPGAVSVREGGGEENLCASLAVTVAKFAKLALANQRKEQQDADSRQG